MTSRNNIFVTAFVILSVNACSSTQTSPDVIMIQGCDTVIQKSRNIKTGVDSKETLEIIAKLTAALKVDADKIESLEEGAMEGNLGSSFAKTLKKNVYQSSGVSEEYWEQEISSLAALCFIKNQLEKDNYTASQREALSEEMINYLESRRQYLYGFKKREVKYQRTMKVSNTSNDNGIKYGGGNNSITNIYNVENGSSIKKLELKIAVLQQDYKKYNGFTKEILQDANEKLITNTKMAIALFDEITSGGVIALDIQRELHALNFYKLGKAYHRDDQLKRAKKAIESAIDISPKNNKFIVGLGLTNLELKDNTAAIRNFENALNSTDQLSRNNQSLVSELKNNIGFAWNNKGEHDKAIVLYEENIASDLKKYGPNHPSIAISMNNLGTAWYNKGNNDLAIQYSENALKIDMYNSDPDYRHVSMTEDNLGSAWLDKGVVDKALVFYKRALNSSYRTLETDNPDSALILSHIAKAYAKKGEITKAITSYEDSLNVIVRYYDDRNPYFLSIKEELNVLKAKRDNVDTFIEMTSR